MPKVESLVRLLLALGLAAEWAYCQDAPPQASGPVIKSSAQEVVLDLVVRDSKGRQVKNLQQSDVEIDEDGVRQEVKSFRFVSGKEIVQEQTAAAKTGAAKQTPVVSNPLRGVNLVCIVLHNMDQFTKKYAVDGVQEFLKNQFLPDTWIAVLTLDSKLNVLQPFTTNKNEVMQATARAYTGYTLDFARVADAVLTASPNMATIEVSTSGNPAKGGTVTATMNVTGGELNPRAIIGADVSTGVGASLQRGDLVGQRRQFGEIEGMRGIDQMLAMISQLATLPGRKSVLLFSPGLSTTGDADLFKAMVEKANKASISVYGIDINGLSENSNGLASSAQLSHAASLSASQAANSSSAAVNMEKMRQSDYVGDAVRTTDTQASLRGFSEGTGGFLIGSTNDLRKPFQRLLEDVDTHYEVIYRPANEKYDGHLRSIEVKTTRADLSVESRTGYFAMPASSGEQALQPFEMAALGALSVKSPPHAFDLHSKVYQFRTPDQGPQNALAFEVPAESLTAIAVPNRTAHRIHAALLVLVKDSTGQVVDKFSQDSAYEVQNENLAQAQKSSITFTHPLDLPPGHYSLEAAVLDRESNRASTAKIQFNSSDEKGLGLSSIVLVQKVEPVNGKIDAADPFQVPVDKGAGERVIPDLAETLNTSAKPAIYFVVYPDKAIAEKPRIRVEFIVGGQRLAKQDADLPLPDASGAIPMVVSAVAKPGNCELRITALQGNASTMQSLYYTVAAR